MSHYTFLSVTFCSFFIFLERGLIPIINVIHKKAPVLPTEFSAKLKNQDEPMLH